MARYDMRCESCDSKVERECPIAECEAQPCDTCGATMTLLFSPPSVIFIPNAYKYAFSDLFGTSSEKDFLKANPDLVPAREVNVAERPKERMRRKSEQAARDIADIERAIHANKTLTVGGTKTDIVSPKTVRERQEAAAKEK